MLDQDFIDPYLRFLRGREAWRARWAEDEGLSGLTGSIEEVANDVITEEASSCAGRWA